MTHTGIRAHTDAHEYKTNTPTNTETHTNKSNTDVCVLLRVLSGMMTWKIIVYFSVEAGRLLEKKGKENQKKSWNGRKMVISFPVEYILRRVQSKQMLVRS